MSHPVPIFEDGDFITVSLKVLHNFESLPIPRPIGKIGNLDEFKLIPFSKTNLNSDENIFEVVRFFLDPINTKVQLFRLFAYPVFLIFIYNFLYQISLLVRKFIPSIPKYCLKKGFIRKYKKRFEDEETKLSYDTIFDVYYSYDMEGLLFLNKVLEEEDRLSDVIRRQSSKHIFIIDADSFEFNDEKTYEKIINLIQKILAKQKNISNISKQIKKLKLLTKDVFY